MTDPYRPFPASPSAKFPRARLERAGVPAGTVDDLEASFPGLSEEERNGLVGYVDGHSDAAVAERYGSGAPTPPDAGPSEVTRETLEDETVDELEARIRAWNFDHPEEHLAVSGRKGELIGRLLDAYESEQGEVETSDGVKHTGTVPASAALPPAPDGAAGPVADQQLPTAPVTTTPEGTPAQTPDAAGAGDTPTPGGNPA